VEQNKIDSSLISDQGKTSQEKNYQGLEKSTKVNSVPEKSTKQIDTREEIAKIAGVSHDTIARVEKIEAKAKYRCISCPLFVLHCHLKGGNEGQQLSNWLRYRQAESRAAARFNFRTKWL